MPLSATLNGNEINKVFVPFVKEYHEYLYDIYFAWFFPPFGWKGTPINVKIREDWTKGSKGSQRTWELLWLGLPDRLKDQRGAIIQSQKDALTVWAYDGNTDEFFKQLNQNTIVQFKF